MKKRLLYLIFIVIVAGMEIVGCRKNPDHEGVHSEGGVHDPNGVLDQGGPGPKAQKDAITEDVVHISSSGELIAKSFALSDFSKVRASMFDVDIQQGESFAVTISVDRNALEHVEVTVEDGWLTVGLDPERAYNSSDIVLNATVTMPELKHINLSLSSDSTVLGFESDNDVSIELDLASSLAGQWSTGDCEISLSLASHLLLTGTGQDMTLTASGSSVADLADFQVASATVHAEGNSQVTINATRELVTTTDGSSTVVGIEGG